MFGTPIPRPPPKKDKEGILKHLTVVLPFVWKYTWKYTSLKLHEAHAIGASAMVK